MTYPDGPRTSLPVPPRSSGPTTSLPPRAQDSPRGAWASLPAPPGPAQGERSWAPWLVAVGTGVAGLLLGLTLGMGTAGAKATAAAAQARDVMAIEVERAEQLAEGAVADLGRQESALAERTDELDLREATLTADRDAVAAALADVEARTVDLTARETDLANREAALATAQASAAQQAAPAPAAAAPAVSSPSTSVYFDNCDAARAAGAAPVRRGDPGYRAGLDRDNDGVGCE